MFIPEKNIFSIVGSAFSVYGKNAKYLAVITVMAFVPVFIFRHFIPEHYYAAVMAIVDTFADAWVYILAYGHAPEITPVVPTAVLTDAMTFFIIFSGIELVFFPLSTAAAVYLVAKHLDNEEPNFGGMFSASMPIFPKMIVTSALAATLIYLLIFFTLDFLGGILMFLTIYIAVGVVFYQHIVADVGRWGLSAISLSRFIVRGRWFRVFFGCIFLFGCYFLISFSLEVFGLLLGLQGNVFVHLPFFLIQHFVLSFFAIAFALWYFDIKRFHALSFQQVEKDIIEKMQKHMDRFGRDKDEDEDEENK
ncbi:MAG: hypothetical protein FWC76_00735 [Defluviitaleaceae bacterium]|nr:hypothetical protein [Defluviitaleaceae bacterium]